MVGFIDHDISKWREPNYTMRPKTTGNNYETTGPGPAISVPVKFTRDGKDYSPEYSMRCACPPLQPYSNPGPPTYKTEDLPPPQETRAPKYTMRARCRYPSGDIFPAPNTYSVPPVMGRGQPWFPEDPGCTAVMIRNQYNSYMKDLANTPGPATLEAINMDVTHHRAPKYTMRPKPPLLQPFNVPGPGSYNNELVTLNKPKIIEKTMGYRHSEFAGLMVNKLFPRCRPVDTIHNY